MKKALKKSVDMLKVQAYDWSPYPTFRGVGDA